MKAFRDGFDNIEWDIVELDMERRGHKLVKTYGPAAKQTVEHFFIPDITNS